MLEIIFTDRCNQCGDCVTVCPTNVLALTERQPRIADPFACQTCFMCELYCSEDTLYVHPDPERLHHPSPAHIAASGLLGQYRRDSGWDEWAQDPAHQNEHWRMDAVFTLARSRLPA